MQIREAVMKRLWSFNGAIFGVILMTAAPVVHALQISQTAAKRKNTNPVVPQIINVDLRTLTKTSTPHSDHQSHGPHAHGKTGGGGDPTFGTPILNQAGQPNGVSGASNPAGDVGLNYYIQAVEGNCGSFVIYDKLDGTVAAGPFSLDAFSSCNFSSTQRCVPTVMYDRVANRWLLIRDRRFDICILVSQTGDPVAGGWYHYDLDTDLVWNSQSIWGMAPSGYFRSSYFNDDVEYDPLRWVQSYDRDRMLAGDPLRSDVFAIHGQPGFVEPMGTRFEETIIPAVYQGPVAPDPDDPLILGRVYDDEYFDIPAGDPQRDFVEIFEAHPDYEVGGVGSIQGPIRVPIADIDLNLCTDSDTCVPMQGSALHLETHKLVLSNLLFYDFGNHQSIVGSFAVDADGANKAGVHWFELKRINDGSWFTFQEGTFSPDDDHRWLGAAAADGSGNIALAYSVSGGTQFPGLRYVGRRESDPPGTLSEGEHVLVNGLVAGASESIGRWSSLKLDPADDCTLWFTGSYNETAQGETQIAAFRFDACGCVPPATPANLMAQVMPNNQVDLSWDAAAGADRYFVYRAIDGDDKGYRLAGETTVNSFSDAEVSGSVDYLYTVRAIENAQNCLSDFSETAMAHAQGACARAPEFDGVRQANNTSFCAVELSWLAATGPCSGDVRYNVYRSQTPGFTPSQANLIAACIDDVAYLDIHVVPGLTYYYMVRAEAQTGSGNGPCSGGHEDGNLSVRAVTLGSPDVTYFEDDFETMAPLWNVAEFPGTSALWWWFRRDTRYSKAMHTPCEVFSKDMIAWLRDPVVLGAGAVLEFVHRYDLEPGQDGGVLEYSTDGGANWFDILEGDGAAVPADPNRILNGGYTGVFNAGRPLAGRPAWFGEMNQFLPVRVDLSAMAGATVNFRWRMVNDGSSSCGGWWYDNVRIISQQSTACSCFATALDDWPQSTVLDLLGCFEAR